MGFLLTCTSGWTSASAKPISPSTVPLGLLEVLATRSQPGEFSSLLSSRPSSLPFSIHPVTLGGVGQYARFFLLTCFTSKPQCHWFYLLTHPTHVSDLLQLSHGSSYVSRGHVSLSVVLLQMSSWVGLEPQTVLFLPLLLPPLVFTTAREDTLAHLITSTMASSMCTCRPGWPYQAPPQ